MPIAPVRDPGVWMILLFVALVALGPNPAAGVATPRADDFPRPSAAALDPKWDDPTVIPEERARRALAAAATLDEQAQRSKNLAERRVKWLEAAKQLDLCLTRNPSVESAPLLQFQAAIYLWARSRALLDAVDLLPATDPGRLDVARGFDNAITRLRDLQVKAGEPGASFAQNVRFRLAQAIADRARLRAATEPDRIAAEKEAQALLDRSLNAPQLKVFARLLHAELANRLGQYGPAQIEVEEVEKLNPPPPVVSTLEAKVTALTGRRQFTEAAQVIDRAPVALAQKNLWKLRIALVRREQALFPRDQATIEAEVFDLAGKLLEDKGAESRRGLMELARAIAAPGPNGLPAWWDLLAEGHLLLLEPRQAAKLALRGADRAATLQAEQAPPLRFKAGACWFQAEDFAAADPVLTQVFDDPIAPAPLRARAGMLRALSRGRALALKQPGSSKTAYLAALEAQIRQFPDDPATGEGRWLLGKLRVAANRPDDAIALWSGIAHGHPRWLEAQTEAADLAILAVKDQWTNHDPTLVRPRVDAARATIRRALDAAAEGDEAVSLGLRLGRLELIPGVGQPPDAANLFDRLLRGPGNPEQHHQARLGRLVAFAEQNRFAEAEASARNEAKTDDFGPLLSAVRLLDQAASNAEADLIRKRTGSLIRTLLERWVEPIDRTPPESRDEVRLRYARALIFGGDMATARKVVARWGGPSGGSTDADFLRDLGDTYFRLEAYALAIDVERFRAAKLPAGSPGWFDARYSLALALFRSERGKEARKVIDATMILHPDLGGGETRAKFERLGQKIGAGID